MTHAIERFFELGKNRTRISTEAIAGLTTFVTMAYILFVNPAILGSVADSSGHSLDRAALLTSTALVSAAMTLAMGLASNLPLSLAPGMGLNAVVAFQLVSSMHLTWPEAMGVIVSEGIIITALVLTGFREAVMNAIPLSLKRAIAVGIGVFLSLIGFVDAGFVSRPAAGPVPVQLAQGHGLSSPQMAVFAFAVLLTAALVVRKVPGALIIGIIASTLFAGVLRLFFPGAWPEGVAALPSQWIAWPDFSLLGAFSFGFVKVLGVAIAAVTVFAVMLSDFFDTMGTVVAVGQQAGFLDAKGRVPRLRAVLLVDSLAAAAGGAVGASSATTYVESAAGASAGGRTGLTSVVCGLLFVACLALSPLAGIIPPQATGAVLVIVGFHMMQGVADIPWGAPLQAIPAFLTVTVMPFTYSITNGIGAGMIAYAVLAVALGRWRQLHPLMIGCAVAFAAYFVIGPT